MRRGYSLLAFLALALALSLAPAPAAAQRQVAPPFRDYYASHQGMRMLGPPISDLLEVAGYPAQYFEKGRIEDHSNEVSDPVWQLMFGRLTAELIEVAPATAVSATSLRYADLQYMARPELRRAPPPGFTGGVTEVSEGTWPAMFVPYDSRLRPAPGYVVPMYFWEYMRRTDLFPGSWLHDIGLPMTPLLTVEAVKNGQLRTIQLQAFERTVLTYDVKNPVEWMVERANLGSDLLYGGRPAPQASLELPAAGARVTLPFPVVARAGLPGEQITATLRWPDGTQTTNYFTALTSETRDDARGLVIGLIDWLNPYDPPATGIATLELRDGTGTLLARRDLLVLGPGDPDTRVVDLYWLFGEDVRPHPQRIVRSERIGAATLEALLWGPPRTQMSFGTALPTPRDVLSYPGRQPGWGARVTLRSLVIRDGVATADFSRELWAYGGGSSRVRAIYQQISRTLLQFPSVRDVRVTIEGQSEGVLEP